MLKAKRFLSIFVCVAMLVGALPFLVGFAPEGTRPGYIPNHQWSFAPPAQPLTPFSTRIVPVENANLSSLGDHYFSASISPGWTEFRSSTSVISGALDLHRFNIFRANQIQNHPRHFNSPPPVRNALNNNIFVLGNRTSNATSRASFTSDVIEFQANSYYVVSVDFYAVMGFGSFYLNPQEEFDNDYRPRINLTQYVFQIGGTDQIAEERSIWQTAQFFISTDMHEIQRASLGLHLGSGISSGGVIYFQNPRIEQVNRTSFNNMWGDLSVADRGNARRIELSSQPENPYGINTIGDYYKVDNKKINERASFPFEVNDQNQNMPPMEASGIFARPAVLTSEIPGYLNFRYTNHVHLYDRAGLGNVAMVAANNAQASLRLEQPLRVQRHLLYMVSFYVLTSNGSSSSVRFNERYRDTARPQLPNDKRYPDRARPETFIDSDHLELNTEGIDHKNGWALNTFFIRGNSHYDVTLDIEFWVGQENLNATDFIMIDGFNIQRISFEYLEAHVIGAGEQSYITLDRNQPTDNIPNAFFNIGNPRSVTNPYPMRPNADWALEYQENSALVLSGIVNTQPEHWTRHNNHGNAITPGSIRGNDLNNNVFMMQNLGTTWQTLSSSPIALNNNITNIISFDLFRQLGSAHQVLDFKVTAEVNNHVVATIDLSSRTNRPRNRWETVSFAIHSSVVTQREVFLRFHMGTENNPAPAGVIFIDNFTMRQTENQNEIRNADTFTDLRNTNVRGFFVADELTDGAIGGRAIVAQPGENMSLQVSNFNTRHATTARNTFPETLNAGVFYEYVVTVRIIDQYVDPVRFPRSAFALCRPVIEDDTVWGPPITSGYDCERHGHHICGRDTWGINFTLEGFQGGFHNISSRSVSNMQFHTPNPETVTAYRDLVFFIRPDADQTLSLVITFGDSHTAILADVLIASTSLRIIEEHEFHNARDRYNNLDKDVWVSHMSFITEVYIPGERPERGPRSPFQWYIIVPSLIMSIAVIAALIGFFVKRFKFKWHIDKKHTSYTSDDRTARLSKKENRMKKQID